MKSSSSKNLKGRNDSRKHFRVEDVDEEQWVEVSFTRRHSRIVSGSEQSDSRLKDSDREPIFFEYEYSSDRNNSQDDDFMWSKQNIEEDLDEDNPDEDNYEDEDF